MTAHEAWELFWSEYMAKRPKRIPTDLSVANLTYMGRVSAQWGDGTKKKKLGAQRIKSLLDKYAPGQFEFYEQQTFFKKK